jgi:hypothetical protein
MKKYFFMYCCLPMLLLMSCTATFNWREIRFNEQGFVALLPAKNHLEQKSIAFENQQLMMTMVAAKAGGILFAVGTIPYLTKDVSGEALMRWMSSNTEKIVHSQVPVQMIQFEVKTAQTPKQIIPAQGYNLKGFGPDGIYRIYWVRWIIRKDEGDQERIYQLSAIQSFNTEPSEQVKTQTTEQIETFMGGFHPD